VIIIKRILFVLALGLVVYAAYIVFRPQEIYRDMNAASPLTGQPFDITLDLTVRRRITLTTRMEGRVTFNGVDFISIIDLRNDHNLHVTGEIPPDTFISSLDEGAFALGIINAYTTNQLRITPGGSRLRPNFEIVTIAVLDERLRTQGEFLTFVARAND
jgi:hypothetical protein